MQRYAVCWQCGRTSHWAKHRCTNAVENNLYPDPPLPQLKQQQRSVENGLTNPLLRSVGGFSDVPRRSGE